MIINARFNTHALADRINAIQFSCNALTDLIYENIVNSRKSDKPLPANPVILESARTWATAWMKQQYLELIPGRLVLDEDTSTGVWRFYGGAEECRSKLRDSLRQAKDRTVTVNLLIRGY